MKKIIVLVLVAFAFLGCGENLENNSPSFQGKKDGNLWEAVNFRANIDESGVLRIVASDNFETITLEVNSTTLGIHDIVETTSSGSLLDIEEIFYSSNNMPDPSVQIYPASGIINLNEVNVEAGYVTGDFYFNAFNSSGLTSVNVNKGHFFKVPLGLTNDDIDEDCVSAALEAATTLVAFDGVLPGDANYTVVCTAYKAALTELKAACGDSDGSIQTLIDGLTCM